MSRFISYLGKEKQDYSIFKKTAVYYRVKTKISEFEDKIKKLRENEKSLKQYIELNKFDAKEVQETKKELEDVQKELKKLINQKEYMEKENENIFKLIRGGS